jgi:putative DNA primase/helicase
LIPYRFDPDAPCPNRDAFLATVTGGDAALAAYLQRAVGYALIGGNPERVLLILHGEGRNGKSTFLETLKTVFADYAKTTAPSTLIAKRGDSIPNDVPALKGARFVTATETEDGGKFAAGLIKQMTGNDEISARFMRAEWFSFRPDFTICLATNHKTRIPGNDQAI